MVRKRWGKEYKDGRCWREYNEKLVLRGEAYISIDFLAKWDNEVRKMNRQKRGKPFTYPESLMKFMAYLHVVLGIDYRGLEGFWRGVSFRLNLNNSLSFKVPDYSAICRRVNKLELKIKETLIPYRGEEVVISLDSTGVKVSNRGEWMRHKWGVRRGWIKVHASVEGKNKQVVGLEITEEKTGDSAKFRELVKQSKENLECNGNRISQANADGAFDSNDNFQFCENLKIQPAIKIRRSTRGENPPKYRGKYPRKKYRNEYYELGYKRWRDKHEYGKRWHSEIPHSVVKRKFGEFVRASKKENMLHEAAMKYLFYNIMILYDETNTLPWS